MAPADARAGDVPPAHLEFQLLAVLVALAWHCPYMMLPAGNSRHGELAEVVRGINLGVLGHSSRAF